MHLNTDMTINEIINELQKPPSPEQARIDALKRQKDQVSKSLKVAQANKKIQSGTNALRKVME